MKFKSISPLGERNGHGTFDTFYDTNKYQSLSEAEKENDYVVVNFVIDEDGVIYFEGFHTKFDSEKVYERLHLQHFPLGLDVLDDNIGCEMAQSLLGIIKEKESLKSEKKVKFNNKKHLNSSQIIKDPFPIDFGDLNFTKFTKTGWEEVEGIKGVQVEKEEDADVIIAGSLFYKINIKPNE